MTSLAPLLKKISKMELGFDANKPPGKGTFINNVMQLGGKGLP